MWKYIYIYSVFMPKLMQIFAVATVIPYFTRRTLRPHSLILYALICNFYSIFYSSAKFKISGMSNKKDYGGIASCLVSR